MKPIYLDYNATTPLDPVVIEAMRPYLEGHFRGGWRRRMGSGYQEEVKEKV